jgi:hypothetical protein
VLTRALERSSPPPENLSRTETARSMRQIVEPVRIPTPSLYGTRPNRQALEDALIFHGHAAWAEHPEQTLED